MRKSGCECTSRESWYSGWESNLRSPQYKSGAIPVHKSAQLEHLQCDRYNVRNNSVISGDSSVSITKTEVNWISFPSANNSYFLHLKVSNWFIWNVWERVNAWQQWKRVFNALVQIRRCCKLHCDVIFLGLGAHARRSELLFLEQCFVWLVVSGRGYASSECW
jgi:hypothetical protein